MSVAEPAIGIPYARASSKPKQADLVTACSLVLVLWLVYFRAVPHLGLYNDDYYNVGFPASLSFSQVWSQCLSWLVDWPNGRPLSACIGWMAAFVLVHAGGIHAIYLLPLTLVALNSFLIYYIVSRKTTALAGFIAAVAYALSPVDTLRLQYTVAFQYQTCIAVTLFAFIFYAQGKHVLAYITLLGSLLFHECAVLGFLSAPLLNIPWRRVPRALARNTVLTGCIIAAVLFVRSELMNESRTQSVVTNASTMLRRSLQSGITGPQTHLRLLGTRTLESFTRPLFPQVRGTLLGLVLILGSAVLLLCGLLKFDARPNLKAIVEGLKHDERPPPALLDGYARIFMVGAIIFVVNYLVFFLDPYYPANHTAGMIALVHTASGVGASLCIAVCAELAIAGLGALDLRFVALGGVLLCLAGLGAWGSLIRAQYETSWSNQQRFWRSITTLVPDAGDGTLIIVETAKPSDLPYTWVIGSNSWADTVVPRMLYRCSWNNPPMLYVFSPTWRSTIQNRNGEPSWIRPPSLGIPGWEALPQGNIVVLQANDGVFTRLQGPLDIPAGVLHLKPPPPPSARPVLSDGLVRRYLLPK